MKKIITYTHTKKENYFIKNLRNKFVTQGKTNEGSNLLIQLLIPVPYETQYILPLNSIESPHTQ